MILTPIVGDGETKDWTDVVGGEAKGYGDIIM
jgi:hypothetical protein